MTAKEVLQINIQRRMCSPKWINESLHPLVVHCDNSNMEKR